MIFMNEGNEVLTEPEDSKLTEIGGVNKFRFPKQWLKVLRSKLPEPMKIVMHLEETPEGRIILVGELVKDETKQ